MRQKRIAKQETTCPRVLASALALVSQPVDESDRRKAGTEVGLGAGREIGCAPFALAASRKHANHFAAAGDLDGGILGRCFHGGEIMSELVNCGGGHVTQKKVLHRGRQASANELKLMSLARIAVSRRASQPSPSRTGCNARTASQASSQSRCFFRKASTTGRKSRGSG